jgi:hypothetical protein
MSLRLPWITEWDIMVGVDGHNELCIPPTPAVPSPMHKHLVFGTMRWALNDGQWPQHNVFVENRLACQHLHDISYLIPHVPIPLQGWVLLPAIIPLSSSKIALGAFSVKFNNHSAGAWGPTLNCWSNFPRPSGIIIPTRLPTVFVGVSFVDVLRSCFHLGVDMLLSLFLNSLFKGLFEKRLLKSLEKTLGKVAGDLIDSEVVTAINQAVVKIASEITKKLFGKLGKRGLDAAGLDFLKQQVTDWHARTNPGMEEKYIKVFEAEAPLAFATHLFKLVPEIRNTALEVLSQEDPELDKQSIGRSVPNPPFEEFAGGITETMGAMIRDSVRGLLSGNEWKELLGASDTGTKPGGGAPAPA